MALRGSLPRLALLSLLASGAVVAATDCSELTQVVIVVDTDLAPSDVDRVDVTVTGPNGNAGDRSAEAASLPLSFSVQAGSNPSADLTIVAVAKRGGADVLRRTAVVRMTDGKSTLVHLSLCRACGATCADVTTTTDFTGTVPSAPSCSGAEERDGGGDAGDGGPPVATRCPGAPREMTLIATPGGKRFCIDTTEVTTSAYDEFLKSTAADASTQPPECAFNTDFSKPQDPGGSPECELSRPVFQLDPATRPDVPMTCADWCDARAYCAWKGKHLCGRIGERTQLDYGAYVNPEVSEWYAACSNLGATTYPYGNAEDQLSASCNVDTDVAPTVCNRPTCRTDAGVCDMVGNVWEWEDACELREGLRRCLVRGGSARAGNPGIYDRCNIGPTGKYADVPINTSQNDIGFRCCADPLN
ncbi:MAG: SUMF1/EgtB/PvdO family nonheme iron enzyme [Labilithrix sp.]|nr:SUMF1/EgtB/PvdO family nonheme iron enzyme [Labilithrix sp.]MCW5814047.1 SUMF1/EgtB/PvdO family nonheme iron enzyme [Labilithrix sp.]